MFKEEQKEVIKMGFIKFMSSTAGRVLRALVGIVLLVWGISASNAVLDVLGVFFIAVGVFDVCVFAPLFKLPLSGKKVRDLK